jgi:hypothetical protein
VRTWRRTSGSGLTGKAYRLVGVVDGASEPLVEEVNLGGWLAVFPGTGGQPQTYQLSGAPDEQVGGPAFNAMRDALHRDSEQLPLRGPVQPTREFLRMLDRRKIVLDRVDPDGSVHPAGVRGRLACGLGCQRLVESSEVKAGEIEWLTRARNRRSSRCASVSFSVEKATWLSRSDPRIASQHDNPAHYLASRLEVRAIGPRIPLADV